MIQLNFFDSVNDGRLKASINSEMANSEDILSQIRGLKYMRDFISNQEHGYLWDSINKENWLGDIKRRVQHYGWKYDYKARSIDYTMFLGALPDWSMPIAERLRDMGIFTEIPDQLIINEYKSGQGIANHIDCEPCFGDTIVSISLGAATTMNFINVKTQRKIDVLLEPRSLAVISGEARYNWTHGIAPRKSDIFHGHKFERELRISMTFRKVIIK